MCDAAVCRAMTLGPPMVRVDALSELAEAVAGLLPDRAAPPSSGLPGKEAADEATDVTTAKRFKSVRSLFRTASNREEIRFDTAICSTCNRAHG